jgi:phenylpropionate dioxygenase-like ring-hydroxylating dioxygenase large terminal subunit
VAVTEQKWSALPVLHAIERADRIPKERYYDPDFFELEAELLWPRVWQMACRLEEIPQPFDCTTYEILDQSVILLRTEDRGVRAFQNACRHRGVRLVRGRDHCESGFTCPFHGWCYGTDGSNTFVSKPGSFDEQNLLPGDIDLTSVRCEVWGGCAWINFDNDAPPVRECFEPMATVLDAWKLGSMRAEKWYAGRLPVNWKLAEEAFVEQYHVIETHPQLVDKRRFPPRKGTFDPVDWVDAELRYLHMMSDGMDGMVHADDVAVAETLRTMELPADPSVAIPLWHRTLNDAVTDWHRERQHDVPDLNALGEQSMNEPMSYCFPHFFVLPMYSSASSYRFRPLGPEETLMEIWSLARFPEGTEPEGPEPPEVWECDDARWPPIPAQDFSNLPRQQKGLHARGFEYMRLSQQAEGHISNWHRLIDGYLAGLPYDKLLPALGSVNSNPLEMPIVDLPL